MAEKEKLDIHISIIDLLCYCCRNSAFCITQVQKLLECEELLDSLITDAVPYVIKKHYFMLLFEVYLRKVPGLTDMYRLNLDQLKFIQVMKWVVNFDLVHSYNHYIGLMVDATDKDSPEQVRKLKQVKREIERVGESEYEMTNAGKSEKDKEDEKRFKQELTSYVNSVATYNTDTNDKTEFWQYLYKKDTEENCEDGLLLFIENFFRDYTVKEIATDDDIKDVSTKLRERLLQMSNRLFDFYEQHGDKIRDNLFDYVEQINRTVRRLPTSRSFRMGKRRIVVDGVVVEKDEDDVDEAELEIDESRDLENRMCGENVLKVVRNYIISENITIRQALGIEHITNDVVLSRDFLKIKIKEITGGNCSYDDIMKALDHFHKSSYALMRQRSVSNVEPGQAGYVLNLTDNN